MAEVVVTMQDSPDGANPEGTAHLQLSPEEELASLRSLVAEKDHAVIRAVVSTSELQQALETAKAEADELKEQLVLTREQPQEAIQAVVNGELLKLNAKFNHARKMMEREHGKTRTELISLRAQTQQLQHQLESEKRARAVDAARASGKIASLEKDLSVAYGEKSASGEAVSREKAIRTRLSAAAVVAAIVIAVVVGWSQVAAKTSSAESTPQAAPASTAVERTQAAIPSQFSMSQHGFQTALSRLNNVLANFPDQRPEDVLADVRRRMAKTDPTVCAFDWNNGQPALLYGGQTKSVSLVSTLSSCAQAIETTRLH